MTVIETQEQLRDLSAWLDHAAGWLHRAVEDGRADGKDGVTTINFDTKALESALLGFERAAHLMAFLVYPAPTPKHQPKGGHLKVVK